MKLNKKFASYVISGLPLEGCQSLTYSDDKLYLSCGDAGLKVYSLKDEMESGIEHEVSLSQEECIGSYEGRCMATMVTSDNQVVTLWEKEEGILEACAYEQDSN